MLESVLIVTPSAGNSVAECEDPTVPRSKKSEGSPRSQWKWTSSPLLNVLLCAAVVLAAFLYMHHYMLRGWVSHDEGTLAQTADRVLHGELPHRDFDDVYTGGLAYLNAVAFRIFGPTLASFRYMLMIFALAWTAAIYFCASRFLAPFGAALATLLAVAWGPANYFAALPSWYNLFFATFGMAALLRYTQVKHWRWPFLAGLCGGISVLFKISGLYFVVAAGLWLIAFNGDDDVISPYRRISAKGELVLAAIAAFLYELFLFRLAMTNWKLPWVLCFFAPAAFVGIAVLIGRSRDLKHGSNSRIALGSLVAFVSGVIAPVAIFLIPYLRRDGIGALISGVFVEPMKRLKFAAFLPLHMDLAIVCLLGVMLLLALIIVDSGISPKITGGIVAFLLTVLVLGSAQKFRVYQELWTGIFFTYPVLIILGSLVTVFRRSTAMSREYRSKAMLVILVAAMCALVQFPFSAPIYFCYVTALGVLLGAALAGGTSAAVRFNSGLVAVVLLGFAVFQVAPVFIHNLGWGAVEYQATYVLKIPSAGGIRVPAAEGQVYDRVADVVHEHARGEYIFAAPDCPELYFLTGHRNPTGTFYDFLTDNSNNLVEKLKADQINLIVVNYQPEFSPPIRGALLATLNSEFPKHQAVGPFDIRWRE